MKLLLDTHLLLWAAGQPERLSKKARALIEKDEHELFFSSGSLWEIVIKRNLGRDDFKVDARILRRGLLDNGTQSSRSPVNTSSPSMGCLSTIKIRSIVSWSPNRLSKGLRC